MGEELGGRPPGLGHSVQGGSRGLAPGLGHGVQKGELTHFVTGSVNCFVVFHAFRNLYTPPKTPLFPQQVPGVIRGFPPHIIDTRA